MGSAMLWHWQGFESVRWLPKTRRWRIAIRARALTLETLGKHKPATTADDRNVLSDHGW
jgi:hypothetical protein